MQFDANGHPLFDDHDESVYDYEKEEAAGQASRPRLPIVIALTLFVGLVSLIAASVSVWIGVDLIAGHNISLREAVGGGWLITAIGGYAGAKASH